MIEKTKLPLAAFVADNATVRGHVTAGKGSSIYFGAVIRSESDTTAIGEDTNIQDNCVLHTDKGFPITIGRGCTIGHAAILHGCTIGDNTLIGMGPSSSTARGSAGIALSAPGPWCPREWRFPTAAWPLAPRLRSAGR